MFSSTFAGIAPSSVPPFVAAQVIGGATALATIKLLYPAITPAEAARVVVAHPEASGNVEGVP
jgi:arsenate reductase